MLSENVDISKHIWQTSRAEHQVESYPSPRVLADGAWSLDHPANSDSLPFTVARYRSLICSMHILQQFGR